MTSTIRQRAIDSIFGKARSNMSVSSSLEKLCRVGEPVPGKVADFVMGRTHAMSCPVCGGTVKKSTPDGHLGFGALTCCFCGVDYPKTKSWRIRYRITKDGVFYAG